MLPGETISSGAAHQCEECGVHVHGPMVCRSAAGYFIGCGGCQCGPVYSRESSYEKSYEDALAILASGVWSR